MKNEFKFCSIPHRIAKAFIQAHHYAKGASNTSKICIGMFRKSDAQLVGVSMWMLPPYGVIKKWGYGTKEMLSLSRLAISPDVPTNGASMLIGASERHIARHLPEIKSLVTYADEMQGHEGTIYKATNWLYTGQSRAEYAWKDETGKLVSRFRTKSIPVTVMDAQFKRIGPFRKHCFVKFRHPKRQRFTSTKPNQQTNQTKPRKNNEQ